LVLFFRKEQSLFLPSEEAAAAPLLSSLFPDARKRLQMFSGSCRTHPISVVSTYMGEARFTPLSRSAIRP
jgi:hypothetical protein